MNLLWRVFFWLTRNQGLCAKQWAAVEGLPYHRCNRLKGHDGWHHCRCGRVEMVHPPTILDDTTVTQ